MNNKSVILILVSLIVGIVAFVALNNIFIALGVVAIYIVVSMFVLIPLLNQYDLKSKKYHECYHFINNFVIALSIKKSIRGALESTVSSMPNDFIEIYEGTENMDDGEKLSYFSTYFPFYSYRLFLQIIDFWVEEGGDILAMSKFLIDDIRNGEEYVSKSHSLFIKKAVEISTLWGFCLLIIIVLKYALKDFYDRIQGQIFFIISISLTFLFLLFTIYLLVVRGTSLKLKGVSHNEKIS